MKSREDRSIVRVRSLADLSPDEVVAAFSIGFADYLVPIAMTAAQLDARFRAESGDPFASHAFHSGDEPVGILMIGRRGRVGRVGAIGVAPAMRGTGFGADVIRRAVEEASARDDRRLVLEVIEANVRAVKLYERAGFAIVRPLWGFSLDAGRSEASAVAPALEIDPTEGTLRAGRFGEADLPWQLQVPSLAAMLRPTRCYANAEGSIVAMVDASQAAIRLRALALHADLAPAESAAFTAALRHAFPGRLWNAAPIFPEAHRANFFEPGGWTTAEMRQLEMAHALGAS